jgi:hypothetical protein
VQSRGPEPVDPDIAALAAAVLTDLPRHGRDVADAVWARVPAYEASGLVPFDELLANCVAEVGFTMESLRGTPIDGSGAQAAGRRRFEEGMPLPDVMSAYRVGFARMWAILVAEARRTQVPDSSLIRAATRMWDAQSSFMEALIGGYRDAVAERVLQHEEEAAALVAALLEGRVVERLSRWEATDVLGLGRAGAFVVVAAEVRDIGRHPLPGIRDALRVIGFRSAWHLTPDAQMGIVAVPDAAALPRLADELRRRAVGRVGLSPVQPSIAEAPKGLRLARIAMLSATRAAPVSVFGDDVIGAASVASGELLGHLTEGVLSGLDGLSPDERSLLLVTFRSWIDHGGSATEAGRALYCHPNTVRYRLRKLEERTGRSVNDPRSMLELLLAAEADERRGAAH